MLVLEKFKKKNNVAKSFDYVKEMENNLDSSFIKRANLFLKKADNTWDFFWNLSRTVSLHPEKLVFKDLSETDVVSKYILGCYYFVMGKVQETIDIFNWILKRYPIPYVFCALSHVYNSIQQYSLSLDVCERWRKFDNSFEAQMESATVNYLLDNIGTANNFLEQAKKTNPSYFKKNKEGSQNLIFELQEVKKSKKLIREEASDGYTDEFVKVYWDSAKYEFENFNKRQIAHSIVYDWYDKDISNFLTTYKPDGFLDFGCACGLPLYNLSNQHPDVNFAGIDRQTSLVELNGEAFKKQNIKILSGDILDAIDKFMPKSKNKVLCHARTGIMVYPEYLNQLYCKASQHGYKYILLYEIASLSMESQVFREQGNYISGSEVHRSTMFIHDYKTSLIKQGYDIAINNKRAHGHSMLYNNMLFGDTYIFLAGILR
ncbi:TPA: hypothetical protein JBJ19_07140 [Legionella pneumophila]|nr:hypothetical protein [Legionella pneumophila]HAU1847707.1 hypothetical protein [Legionella pneumophila]